MKKYLTRFTIVILVILNFVFCVLLMFEKNKYSFLILDKNTIWKYSDTEIKKVNKNRINRLSYEKVKIYCDNTLDGYYDSRNNKIYDSYLEEMEFSPTLIINKGNNKIKNYSYNITTDIDETDKKNINDALESSGREEKIDNLLVFKLKISTTEILYSISPLNLGIDDDSYSIIFINSEGLNKIIYNKSKSNNKDYRLSSLNRVIDINNDGHVEIILLSDIAGSAGNECYSLYQFNSKNQKYESVIDCEG